ncbi:PREDICTED: oxidation resistance protein 1-like [Nicotiana attenuata]|uniref:TLDc domain-containing protein n=1 Tax=Nicotiana attenuata TaxID=49451 RepID=A0A314LBG7_NICAT|nr:PREDICTED: oxidation resistance protein 1-like [Nicotiana attenuata]OIT38938.1 hypothetical protein A4A49_15999 [Nicotiana attenuata]
MNAIKDTVSEKLSRLFSDSPSKSSDQQPPDQARPYTKEGRSLSSILSFFLPSTNFVKLRDQNDVKSLQSHSFTWRSKSFSWRDRPLERYTDCDDHDDYKEMPNEPFYTPRCNGEPNSARSVASGFEAFEDVPDGDNLEQSVPNLIDDSVFISPGLYDFFQSSLPNIVKGCQWVLLYSTAKHGISLRTLIRKSADTSGPCLLITGDKQGAVFGGLLEAPLKPTAKRKYQGTIQTFVFTTVYGEPRLFRPTGANRYFYLCMNDFLALGGGGHFALCLDGDLLSGNSGPCDTFGNSSLAHNEEFELKNVELWGFTHASRYLTS